jgi:hypothetical protein
VIDMFRGLVKKGNSVQNLDDDGRVVANLGMDLLSKQEKVRIRNSRPSSPVRLLVLLELPEGKGADVCHTSFTVLRILD